MSRLPPRMPSTEGEERVAAQQLGALHALVRQLGGALTLTLTLTLTPTRTLTLTLTLTLTPPLNLTPILTSRATPTSPAAANVALCLASGPGPCIGCYLAVPRAMAV